MSEETAPYGTGPAAQDGPKPVKRVRTHHLREMKERGERFAMLTAYEQYAAQTFDEAGIEVLLVGDSASQGEVQVAGVRLARLVVQQEEQQVLCDQRHRADGTTRD